MKTLAIGTLLAALATAASLPKPDNSAQLIVTVRPAPRSLRTADLRVEADHRDIAVTGLERLAGDAANMQLFVLLDDSTRSSSLGTHFAELRTFLNSLPPTTQVALGYMQHGTFSTVQAFTTDHQKAAKALRLPMSLPGENGSPYFALRDLVKHWPSSQATGRRAVLMLTDGVDPYYGPSTLDDPYLDSAEHEALRQGVQVYSVYLRGAGRYGRGWVKDIAQSRLMQVTGDTGGYAYFEEFSDPVTIAPFLKDLQDRFEHQYLVTIAARGNGVQSVKVKTELPGVKIEAPAEVYMQ